MSTIPTNYKKLGKTGFTTKGEYDSSTTYNRYDVVYHRGSSYIVVQDGVTGSEPSEDNTNYILMAKGYLPEDLFVADLLQVYTDAEGKYTYLGKVIDIDEGNEGE